MAAAKENKKDLPQLDKIERLELQNIMLRMALERERIAKLEAEIATSKKEYQLHESHLSVWKSAFHVKLKDVGFSLDQVDINAETGQVVAMTNVEKLPGRG